MVQVDAVDRATANAPLGIGGIRVGILAMDRASSDQRLELLRGHSATWIELAFSIKAALIELGSVNAVKAKGFAL